MNLGDAMKRAQVLDYNLQVQLYPYMSKMRPRRSVYIPDFIAANQKSRADNLLSGSLEEIVHQIRADIRDFKAKKNLDKVSRENLILCFLLDLCSCPSMSKVWFVQHLFLMTCGCLDKCASRSQREPH